MFSFLFVWVHDEHCLPCTTTCLFYSFCCLCCNRFWSYTACSNLHLPWKVWTPKRSGCDSATSWMRMSMKCLRKDTCERNSYVYGTGSVWGQVAVWLDRIPVQGCAMLCAQCMCMCMGCGIFCLSQCVFLVLVGEDLTHTNTVLVLWSRSFV